MSMTTTCPGWSMGASIFSTKLTNISMSVAPSKLQPVRIPLAFIAAMVLMIFQCPCGVEETRRSPFMVLPRLRHMLVVDPNSSINTG